MPRIYDNWEKLVGAVLRREKDRQLAYCESLSSSSSVDVSSHFSFETPFAGDVQPAAGVDLSNVRAIKYEEIRKATRNFRTDNMLNPGLSSGVYKGWMDEQTLTSVKPEFGIPVAFKIKRPIELKEILEKKWLDEMSHLRHPNLVTPIGYCFDTDRTIFVYEFMPKGSLENHLFKRGNGMQPIPWEIRIKVAVGAARGLAFLHSLEIPIIYGNLKIEDILLDRDFNAKLRSILPAELSMKNRFFSEKYDLEDRLPIIYDTEDIIYTAPEYKATGQLSTECDVYSFGVVLVQLLSGLRDLDRSRAVETTYQISWAKPYLGNKIRLYQIMDSRLKGRYSYKQACTVAKLALQCVSLDRRSRPRMASVVAALQQL